MYLSIFTDELALDYKEALPILKSWGFQSVDFRSMINGKSIANQSEEELKDIKKELDKLGMKCGVIQSSLAKVHLPDKERQNEEKIKLEGIIRACDILQTRDVRAFNYWQQEPEDRYFNKLQVMPDQMNNVLEMFEPLRKRAQETGLRLAFENCGQTCDEVIAFLDALGVKEWGLAWDAANYFDIFTRENEIDYFKRSLEASIMMHVKSWGVVPEFGYTPIPYERLLAGAATLERKDYAVSVETHTPDTSSFSKETTCRMVTDYVKKVWPAAAPANLHMALEKKDKFYRSYSDNPVSFVVVGLGMGKVRAQQLTQTNGCRLYGVCDLNENLAQEVAHQFNVPYSTDLEVFLKDPDVEVIYVVTETGHHSEVASRALDANKHVLMTKPMDANVEKCRSIIRKANLRNLYLGLDFDFQFEKESNELLKAVKNGYFGKILAANVALCVSRSNEYYEHNNHWRGTWALDGGGALSNQGIHEVERMISLFGVPDYVKATIETKNHQIEAEDYGVSEWKYDNGLSVRYSSTTCYLPSSWQVRLEIFGTEGAFYHTVGGPEGDHTYWWKNGTWSSISPYSAKRVWAQASDNFASCIREGGSLQVGYIEGWKSRFVLDKIYESAKTTGGWIKVDYRDPE